MSPGTTRFDPHHVAQRAPWKRLSNSFFAFLGRTVTRYPWYFVGGWVLLLGIVVWASPGWQEGCQDDDIRFMPERCLSVRGYDLLQRAFPREVYGSRLIVCMERQGTPLVEEDDQCFHRLHQEIEALRHEQPQLGIRHVRGPLDPLIGSRLRSADGHCALLIIGLETPFLAQRTRQALEMLEGRVRPIFDEHLKLRGWSSDPRLVFTGPAGMGRDLNDAMTRGFHGTTLATVILVIGALLLVYRSWVLALIPLLSIGLSTWISLHLLSWLALHAGLGLVNITHIFIVVILFGVGTDYCLFLISRSREEESQGRTGPEAVRHAVQQTGWAVTASAVTVICSIGMLGFAEFVKVRSSGPAIAISLVVALLACLTLTPSLMVIVKRWQRSAQQTAAARGIAQSTRARWNQRCLSLLKHNPARVLLGSLLLMLPFAYLGWQTDCVHSVCSDLPQGSPSRLGLEMVKKRFVPGETGPHTILLTSPQSWLGKEPRRWLEQTMQRIHALDAVADVRGLAAPLGYRTTENQEKPTPTWMKAASAYMAKAYLSATKEGHVTRLEVVFKDDPFDPRSQETMRQIGMLLEDQLTHAPSLRVAYCHFGVTAIMHDIAIVQGQDTLRISILVILCVMLIMVVIVRRWWLSLFLVASVLLSYLVTVGLASTLGYLFLGAGWETMDWKVPFFLFTILMAVGADYNIFLVSRVLEHEAETGLTRATLLAAEQTGSAITSCGLIMAGTFASLMLGELATLRQLGLALTIGVLLDTFVIRLFLVPAGLLVHAQWRKKDDDKAPSSTSLRRFPRRAQRHKQLETRER